MPNTHIHCRLYQYVFFAFNIYLISKIPPHYLYFEDPGRRFIYDQHGFKWNKEGKVQDLERKV